MSSFVYADAVQVAAAHCLACSVQVSQERSVLRRGPRCGLRLHVVGPVIAARDQASGWHGLSCTAADGACA